MFALFLITVVVSFACDTLFHKKGFLTYGVAKAMSGLVSLRRVDENLVVISLMLKRKALTLSQ